MIRILYFGKLADLAGTSQQQLSLPAHISDSEQVRTWLADTLPFGDALRDPVVRIAVNDELHPDQHPVTDGDEVAFLPPVGGG